MSLVSLLSACAATAVCAWALTGAVLRALEHWGVYDEPTPRSSHDWAKPRGGGLALIPLIAVAWIAAAAWLGAAPEGFWLVLAGAGLLAVVSWIDDLRGLPVAVRLAVQAAAVALGLAGMDGAGLVFQGLLPPLLDRVLTALLWLWFVNLFNFMDGIDGISGVEAICVGAGLALIGALVAAWPAALIAMPALLAAAALGFLRWNWAPSKLFLGDVGSVPLGYLLGWLLLVAASEGQWAAALILPLYYLADATIVLARRTLRGVPIWQAHREHFYQRAVGGGWTHADVSARVLGCNVLLVLCAGIAVSGHPWPALAAGVVVVAGFLVLFSRHAGNGE